MGNFFNKAIQNLQKLSCKSDIYQFLPSFLNNLEVVST